MRLIDGDALKRKAQKVATESWKMKVRASVEKTLNQFIDWIDAAPVANAIPAEITEDGTLIVVVGKNAVINRVITFYSDSIFCSTFYQDGETEWTPVTPASLPKEDGDYMVTTNNGQLARYVFNKGTSESYWLRCVKAWMPLPSPYNENKEGTTNDD